MQLKKSETKHQHPAMFFYIVLYRFLFYQSSILTQEFEVLTTPIDMLAIREKLAKFLVEQVINKKGEYHHPTS
jgi:hypothetical protein